MILIISNPDDEHADHVSVQLAQRGVDFLRFDPEVFPSQATISLLTNPAGHDYKINCDGETIDFNSVNAVWYRRPGLPQVPKQNLIKPVHKYIQDECAHLFNNLWDALDCLFIPATPPVIRRAELKLFQLKAAEKVDFEIPPTYIGNDPEQLKDFYRIHNGQIVHKVLSSALPKLLRDAYNHEYIRYTEIVPRRLIGYSESLRSCPLVFQAYVPKEIELRITVVGDQVFAAEIHSQANQHTRYDWRRYDLNSTPHYKHTLPDEIAQRCLLLVRYLGLCYGTIDMILTPDGRYVFLEINPNGQYLWIEELTGLPISNALCDMLTARLPNR